MFLRRMRAPIAGIVERLIAPALALCLLSASAAAAPPDETRTVLTAAELLAGQGAGPAPVHNAHFMPVGAHGPARHRFEGTLAVPEFSLRIAQRSDWARPARPGQDAFPAVDLQFFAQDGYLVPVRRGFLAERDGAEGWRLIVSPGRVWSEPGDEGFSRAAFPFLLTDALFNESHNGIATFLFDDTRVSSLRLQVVQEATPWNQLDMWGQSPMTYRPHAIAGRDRLAAHFAEEIARSLPMRPWVELAGLVPGEAPPPIDRRGGGLAEVSAEGLVVDGTIYARPCRARHGDFPFCRYMRHSVYSVTKSMGAALILLRLAEKYGPEIFDLLIADYLDIDVEHDGWRGVTFGHALSMAVGVGYKSRRREPLDILPNEDNPTFIHWIELPSAEDKLANAFAVGDDYPWGPGEVARYDTMHTFILAAAMDALLKSNEGPDADLWDMMQREVLRPIGAYHVPIMRTVEPDGARGLPILGYGLYLTIDDAAKIARLLQDGGRHGGRQLLHAERLAEALYRTGRRGLPTGDVGGDWDYHLSFWMQPYTAAGGCDIWIPVMMGYGGNVVAILPGGMTAFRFADDEEYSVDDLIEAAAEVRPFCPPPGN
jgi:hypothetical protein